MASSGECLAGQIQVSHFLYSFLLCIWVSASTDHSAATSTALTFTVKPRNLLRAPLETLSGRSL